MMNDMKTRYTYQCNDDLVYWEASIEVIKKYHDFISFVVRGKDSNIAGILCFDHEYKWVSFPEHGKSCSLSHLDNVFWNSERLICLFESVSVGISIGKGLSVLYDEIRGCRF